MKYWILTTEYPPDKSGGIGTYVKEHSEAFAVKGHEVLIFYGNGGNTNHSKPVAPNITLQSFSVNSNTPDCLGTEAALSFEFASQVVQRLSTEKPDIIEVQEYVGIGYYLLLRKYAGESLLKDIPIIVTAHAPSFLYLEYNHTPLFRFPEYWIGEMEKFSLLAADLVISPSQYLIDALKKRMSEAFPDTIIQLFNPYQASNIPPAGTVIERKKLVVFGKMSLSKGALRLLQEVDRLWKAGMEFQINWIGGTDIYLHTEEQTMGHFVRNKYKDHIAAGRLVLVGNIGQDQISSHLSAAHAVIIPSLVDNLPYTAIETMANGKVLLASTSGGQAELITHGVTGFLFDWDRAGSFKEQLQQVLSLGNEQLATIGQRAIESIGVCSHENYYARKNAIITSLISTYIPARKFPVIRPQEKAAVTAEKKREEGLTVVIPYFNMGAYVDECVSAVFASSYAPAKVLIIDDGSTDKMSIEKLSRLQQTYPSLQVICQENTGLSAARNEGLKNVLTSYVIFLDPDDSIDADYFSKAIGILEQYENISFVTCWTRYFGNASGTWPAQNPEVPYLLFHNPVHSGCVFNTNDLLQTNGYDPSFVYGMEDYEIAVHMVAKGLHGVCIPEPLYKYRIRKKSMSKSFTNNRQLYLYWLLSTKHATLFNKYGAELSNLLNANGPGYLHDNPSFAAIGPGKGPTTKAYWKNKAKKMIKKYPSFRKPAMMLANLLRK